MLRLFKTIRQKLIIEKKLYNYFVYAIGEIVLVVIGILIALAINNKNQALNLRKTESIYLTGLIQEFKTSQAKLNALIIVNRNNLESAKQLLKYTTNQQIKPSEEELSKLLISTLADDVSFNPNHSLLMEIINSGSLKNLSNPKLRIELNNWVSTIDDISRQEDELTIQREKVLDLFRTDSYSIRTIFDLSGVSTGKLSIEPQSAHVSNLQLLKSREFENNLLLFMLTTEATNNAHYTPLTQQLDNILKLLDEEVNRS